MGIMDKKDSVTVEFQKAVDNNSVLKIAEMLENDEGVNAIDEKLKDVGRDLIYRFVTAGIPPDKIEV